VFVPCNNTNWCALQVTLFGAFLELSPFVWVAAINSLWCCQFFVGSFSFGVECDWHETWYACFLYKVKSVPCLLSKNNVSKLRWYWYWLHERWYNCRRFYYIFLLKSELVIRVFFKLYEFDLCKLICNFALGAESGEHCSNHVLLL